MVSLNIPAVDICLIDVRRLLVVVDPLFSIGGHSEFLSGARLKMLVSI